MLIFFQKLSKKQYFIHQSTSTITKSILPMLNQKTSSLFNIYFNDQKLAIYIANLIVQRRLSSYLMINSQPYEFPPKMSSRIILDNINTSSIPLPFNQEINFQVTFSVIKPLTSPIFWKIIYVGSAYCEDYDQTLEEFQVGPIQTCGTLKFDIACKGPDASKIPRKQLLCVTALLLTASYRNQQFIRVGYYVHNQYIHQVNQPDESIENMPLNQLINKIKRTIISDKPRVTKFNIDWLQQRKKKKQLTPSQDSQSKLDDFFSKSVKQKNQQLSSTQNKNQLRDNGKQSTHDQSQIMISQ